ncbi:MAG: hypothetical protein P4L83_11985 [Nevskia sp.]|nr:hypothetical protein [Nevskia sp.]
MQFNYVLVGEDGRSPAMRLGLTDRPFQEEDIINLDPVPATLQKSGRAASHA